MRLEALSLLGCGVVDALLTGCLAAYFGKFCLFLFAFVGRLVCHKRVMNTAPKKPKAKTPRGLWVGKLRKPAAPKRDATLVPEGRKPWDVWPGDYFESYYFQIRHHPHRLLKCAETVIFAEAVTKGKIALEGIKSDKYAQIRAILDGSAVVSSIAPSEPEASVGDLITAFETVAKMKRMKCYKRTVTSLRLVVAVAKGWRSPMDGLRMSAEMILAVDALPCLVLNEELVLEYMRIMQGGTLNLDKVYPPLVNRTINSTLVSARVVTGRKHREFDVAKLRIDWAVVDGFHKRLLPMPKLRVAEAMPSGEQWTQLMNEVALLKRGQSQFGFVTYRNRSKKPAPLTPEMQMELALCNELLRLLGLRSGELVMARESWLHTRPNGRTFVHLRNREAEKWSFKGKEEAMLPLSDELAARLRERCAVAKEKGLENPFLILPLLPAGKVKEGRASQQPDRKFFCRETHNQLVKAFLGCLRDNKGNHRLRKVCATRIYGDVLRRTGERAKAKEAVRYYLRHSSEVTSVLSYIDELDDQAVMVTDDLLAAWA